MEAFDSDFGCVRQMTACPVCGNEKDDGLLVCWPCYRAHDIRNGLSALLTGILRATESRLIERARAI